LSYVPPLLQVLLMLVVMVAAAFDIRERRIPNWLTAAGLALGLALYGFLFGTAGLLFSLKGLGLALGIYLPLYALRAMGAGDVKLMAAVGSIVGWRNWLAILVLTAIFGGILALALIVGKGRVHRTLQNLGLVLLALRLRQAPYQVNPELDVRSEQALRLPHAVSILLGTLTFLLAAALWAPR
jgi:prepilin peptidase CpaA